MNRGFRLRQRTDFERVRRLGQSTAHPLIVLISLPNELPASRIGVAAGRSIGGAVQRNRAKRRLRAILGPMIPLLKPGFDLVFLARKPIDKAGPNDLETAIRKVLSGAHLFRNQGP